MIEELETLCEMQKLDTQLIEYERKRAEAPRRLAEIEHDLQNAKDKVAKGKEIIEELEKERRRKEQELDSEKERIKKVPVEVA